MSASGVLGTLPFLDRRASLQLTTPLAFKKRHLTYSQALCAEQTPVEMEQDSTNDDRCSAPSAEMPNLEETSFPTAPYLFSVCRVCVTRTPPNHSRPWVKERSLHVAGSGFVIDGRLILTNAHCISYATVVKVQRHLSDQKFLARVVRVCYDCDVAVLGVDSDDFWLIPDPSCPAQKQNLLPLQFGELPNLQDTVRVIGFVSHCPSGSSGSCLNYSIFDAC